MSKEEVATVLAKLWLDYRQHVLDMAQEDPDTKTMTYLNHYLNFDPFMNWVIDQYVEDEEEASNESKT